MHTRCGSLVSTDTSFLRLRLISPQAQYVTHVHSLDTSATRSRPPEVVPSWTNNPSGWLMTGLLAASQRLQLLSRRPNVGQLHLREAGAGSARRFFLPCSSSMPFHENNVYI